MNIILHDLPNINAGVQKIETVYCEIYTKYRNGDKLDIEVLDWLDTANTWLMEMGK